MSESPSTTLVILSHSAVETAALGSAIGRHLRPDDVVLLYGDLGAGKTTLVQGIARALGAREPVTSPTFTLIHEYHGAQSAVVHVDPYRLGGPDDIEGLGFLDYLDQGVVVIVEWAERLGHLAPPGAMEIRIEPMGEDVRRLRIAWSDPRLGRLSEELKGAR